VLFLTYWELNENMSLEERLGAGQKLMASGLFPPEGVNIIRWDITPDGWGVTILEADSEAAVSRAMNVWRAAGTGLFKCTKTSTARPVQEEMEGSGELLKMLASA
jgi:hypothetical protein